MNNIELKPYGGVNGIIQYFKIKDIDKNKIIKLIKEKGEYKFIQDYLKSFSNKKYVIKNYINNEVNNKENNEIYEDYSDELIDDSKDVSSDEEITEEKYYSPEESESDYVETDYED